VILSVSSLSHDELVLEPQNGALKVVSVDPFVVYFLVANRTLLWDDDAVWMDAPNCNFSAATVPRMVCRIVVLKKPMCFGSADGQVTVDVLGALHPLHVSWSGNEGVRVGDVVEVKVVDAVGRICSDTLIMFGPPRLVASIETKNVSCFGGKDGVMDLTVQGGSPPYSFLWSGGGCTDEDVSGNIGDYTVWSIHRRFFLC
jgi:hypothetical protein